MRLVDALSGSRRHAAQLFYTLQGQDKWLSVSDLGFDYELMYRWSGSAGSGERRLKLDTLSGIDRLLLDEYSWYAYCREDWQPVV